VFRYRVLGLSGCRADDWLTKPEPIAWAFARHRPGIAGRQELLQRAGTQTLGLVADLVHHPLLVARPER
jgi:hypothetical protein